MEASVLNHIKISNIKYLRLLFKPRSEALTRCWPTAQAQFRSLHSNRYSGRSAAAPMRRVTASAEASGVATAVVHRRARDVLAPKRGSLRHETARFRNARCYCRDGQSVDPR